MRNIKKHPSDWVLFGVFMICAAAATWHAPFPDNIGTTSLLGLLYGCLDNIRDRLARTIIIDPSKLVDADVERAMGQMEQQKQAQDDFKKRSQDYQSFVRKTNCGDPGCPIHGPVAKEKLN